MARKQQTWTMWLVAAGFMLVTGGLLFGASKELDAIESPEELEAPVDFYGDTTELGAAEAELYATPEEIAAAIQGLVEPIDEAEVERIQASLERLDDAEAHDRLQLRLEERLDGLLRATDAFGPVETLGAAGTLETAGAGDELLDRIERLQVGPEATVEDLRARNEVVAAIAGTQDPVRRQELLQRLEEREAQALDAAHVAVPGPGSRTQR